MRNNWKFILFILLFAVATFAIEMRMPKKFTWNATFSQYDKQPFGCYVFDDVLKSSLPKGYSVVNKTFFQLAEDSAAGKKSYLCIAANLAQLNLEHEVEMRKLLEAGNKVMLVTNYMAPFGDSTNVVSFHYNYEKLNFPNLVNQLKSSSFKRDTLTLDNGKSYAFFTQFAGDYLGIDHREKKEKTIFSEKEATTFVNSLNYTVLVRDARNEAVALKIDVGKGELYIVNTPLLFTNYAMLDGGNAGYIFGLLRHISDLPVVRTEAYLDKKLTSTESQSPLRYLVSQPALRWALYAALMLTVLFMFFTAKRRQRIIPVVTPPENKVLEFIKLIGTLYYQRKDYTDLTRKKIIYFYEQIKITTHIDIKQEELTPELSERLSGKTGNDAQKLYQLLVELQGIQTDEKIVLTESQMCDYIDRMNEILNTL